MPRRRNVPGMQESKTQEARIAALLARPRTHYPAALCFPSAEVSLFCGLKTPRYHPTWPGAVAGTRPSLRTLAPGPPAAAHVAVAPIGAPLLAAAPMALYAPLLLREGPVQVYLAGGAPPPRGAFAPGVGSSAVRLAARG